MAAEMLQTWQFKSHPMKKNSMHILYWNIQHSFQNFPKKWRVRQFFHANTNALVSLIFWGFFVNTKYWNDEWKNTSKEQITQ